MLFLFLNVLILDLVVLSLKAENHDDEGDIEFKLKELTSTIKDFVVNFKKSKSEH